jgi:hypothetical protein
MNVSGYFNIVFTVHRNQLSKWTNEIHFLRIFILQFLRPLYMFRTILSFETCRVDMKIVE